MKDIFMGEAQFALLMNSQMQDISECNRMYQIETSVFFFSFSWPKLFSLILQPFLGRDYDT